MNKLVDKAVVLEKVKTAFPNNEWHLSEVDENPIAVWSSVRSRPLPHPAPGWPVEIEILYYPDANAAMAIVSMGRQMKLQLFRTPNRLSVTLDEALTQLKEWFVDFSSCLQEVVQ